MKSQNVPEQFGNRTSIESHLMFKEIGSVDIINRDKILNAWDFSAINLEESKCGRWL